MAPVRVSLDYLCTGAVEGLLVGDRRFSSAIRKDARSGEVRLGKLGLEGDEQADPSAHGGLNKAVYALPVQHRVWWHERRAKHGIDSQDSALPEGFVGENIGIRGMDGPLEEASVFVGDELHFANAVLRVTEPRTPCFKFNAVMGYRQASRDMVLSARSGFYLAVAREGHLQAGEVGELRPGPRALSVAGALHARRYKYLR